jgi:hypothetical protein
VGLLQFLGIDMFDAWSAGRRQPAFLGHHDFAALAGATFLVGLLGLLLRPETAPHLRRLAVAAGALGLVLAAAVASLIGLVLAGAVLAAVSVRAGVPATRRAAATALVVLVAVGVLALRGGDVADFLRFAQDEPEATTDVETYSHRTLLAYIGGRIFLDHPVAGVGWQGSSEPAAFEPYLADARRRFPDTAPLAFPAPERRHGVQDAYLQTLADLGLIGFGLLLALLLAVARVLRRRLTHSPLALVGALWLLLAAGLWTAQGLVTGIPLAALTWIAVGLVAADVDA